ncbi:MAG: endonuclease/exonuclease/phosphatase family protein [Flavobacterium sp.]
MLLTYYIFSALFLLAAILPFIPHQHWIFRVPEIGRIQVMFLQIIIVSIGLLFVGEKNMLFWSFFSLHTILIVHHFRLLIPYTSLYRKPEKEKVAKQSNTVSVISVNVYQFNQQYQKLIDLVLEEKPDILLTMESNQAWEDALTAIESEYPNFKKVPLENTYGIHFYTKLEVKSIKVNYFISDDLPSIEASIITDDGYNFTFFGVHPPPPSPTEEDTSKERDGELLALGKSVLETKGPSIVVGDFNNVAWAKSSILFRKTSQLIDPRIGRGFVSTYHARYILLRFPIDLFFHSTEIFIQDFKTLRNIGSDHLPLFSRFFINQTEDIQEEEVEVLAAEEEQQVEEMIEDGKEEQSDRPQEVAG